MSLMNTNWIRCIRLEGYFSMNAHKHSSLEINYVESGAATYAIDEQKILMKKGTIVVFDASRPHELMINDNVTKVISIEIDYPFLETFDYQYFLEIDAVYDLVREDRIAGVVIQEMYEAYYSGDLDKYLETGMIYLLELIKKQRMNHYSAQAKAFVAAHYTHIHCVDDVAKHLNISKVHLQRVFKQETGTTVGEYITRIRMSNAAYLLRHTNIAISDMDMKIGMNTRQSFYATFKKYYGISPRSFKKGK